MIVICVINLRTCILRTCYVNPIEKTTASEAFNSDCYMYVCYRILQLFDFILRTIIRVPSFYVPDFT